ncbi:MAG: hypothetical protein IJK92_10690 [Bacteroidales bacterium]|nr:hypothetical protein [Bacteroidales bacterium]
MNNEEKKKNDGFANGLTLIIIGVILTLVTLFDFEIDWHALSEMWPLLLIIIGVCIMPINRWIRFVITMVLLAVGIVAYQHQADGTTIVKKVEIKTNSHPRIIFDDDDDVDDD